MHVSHRTTEHTDLPFPALVGLDLAQQALLLLAADPCLGGVVLAAPVGTGKSSLARGFQTLLAASSSGTLPPFIELPLHIDEDGLLGGLDLEATLRVGRRMIRAGALSRADNGIMYVDELNLLSDTCANVLLSALDRGVVQVERDGLSTCLPARFSLLGSYDPAEGAPRRHLLDRVGLLVVLPRTSDQQQRADVVRNNVHAAPAQWDEELALLQGLVCAARAQLPSVTISDAQIAQLAAAAVAFGVEGQRADLFATRAACAAAALALRDTVEQDDLDLALRLVIVPRATQMPQPPAEQPPPAEPPPPQPADPPPPAEPSDSSAQAPEPSTASAPPPPEEQLLSALPAELPFDLDTLPFRAVRRGRSGSRGTTNGKHGRHIRSAAGDVRRFRIDVAATLRAAAPWQPLRKAGRGQPAIAANQPHIALKREDVRVKQFRSKAGTLFCFAVDASGSMALHRMRQAKGAIHTLLQRAYVHRDRVALLAFRGSAAQVLLPPSQSVELARRALDLLPTGGGTPLASALLETLEIARQARQRGVLQTVLVLITDGRANVGLRAQRGGVQDELQQMSRQVAAAGLQTIIVDTQRSFLSQGEARRLAGWLDGTYVYLPNASGEQIAAAALAATDMDNGSMRRG